MEAGRLWLLGDFIGTNKVIFQIPVYQRNYDWSGDNCNRLLDDIKNIIDTHEKHFLGTIVFMSAKESGFSLREFTVIDGQQRLTTMMILLKALADAAHEIDGDCEEEIQESYLHNKHCAEEFKVKLKPIKSDYDQFNALLKDNKNLLDEDGHISINYGICKKRIDRWIGQGITPVQILEALEKLEIVQIVLEKGIDDPQIIFESINSTGLELSNADLIRNFLLMNADNQEELYENYWLYIENALKKTTDYSNMNLFFLQYIIYKTNSPVTSDRLYERFVKVFKDNHFTQESCLIELKYYADIFKSFVYDENKYSKKVQKVLKGLRQLNQTTCYPFLLHVFDDYEKQVIDDVTLEKTVSFVLTYLLRRIVCGVQSNSLRGFFIYLYSRVFKVAANKNKYYEAINKFVFVLTSKDAMPSDSELKNALKHANVYGNTNLCKYLLMEIENGDGKETLDASQLTIEHVMPQRLGVEWRHITAPEHEEYLHVLGNLTVTGYNSELSNKSFQEKKKIIQENSKAVILNLDILDKEEWTVQNIIARGNRLTKLVMNRYSLDKVEDDAIEFEYLSVITLDDYSEITGKKLVTFNFDGDVYRQNRFAFMLLDVIKLLDKKYPGKLETLASKGYSFSNTKQKHVHIGAVPDGIRNPMNIKPDVYIEANLSSQSVMRFIDSLLVEFGELKSSFSVSVIAEESDDEEE